MYLIFVLAIATALTQGFGITLLLPLLRASQSGGSPEDMGTVEQMLQSVLGWMGIADSMVGILVFIAIVFLGKGGLQFARGAYQGYLQAQLLRELKTQLFDAYSGMDYQYYVKQNAGHFINVINQQVDRFFDSFNSFVGFLTKGFSVLCYFAFAFAITWRFAGLVLGVGIIILFLFKYLNAYVRGLSRRYSEEMSHLNKLLVQSLQSFKYIVSTNQVSHLRSGIVNSVNDLTGYIYRQRIAKAFTGACKEPISVLLIVSIIVIQVSIFEESATPIFVALLLFHRGMQGVLGMQGTWQGTMNKIGSLEMVNDEMVSVLGNQEDRKGESIGPLSEGVDFQGVYYSYNSEEYTLRDININIPANETIALVGESGAGKSTLVDLLTLMLKPSRGTILIDRIPHEEIAIKSWRSQIGYVSQETVVFDDTVANNISLWRGDIEEDPALREEIYDAARRAHADHFIRDLPNGYQTLVGDQGIRLSGGQRQRLFIARELFKQPNLLLLDEATSDLDTASEQHIQNSIDALKGEVTVVIIAHRLSTIKNADQIYVIEEGSVSEKGSYQDLRSYEDGVFRSMVKMQSL